MPSGHGRDRLAACLNLSDNPRLVLVAPRSPTTRTGEHLKPMNRLSDSIIHCVHSKPNGYDNHQTRRSGHHQEGDRGTPLTEEVLLAEIKPLAAQDRKQMIGWASQLPKMKPQPKARHEGAAAILGDLLPPQTPEDIRLDDTTSTL